MRKKSTYYINGIGVISPQRTFDPTMFLNDVVSYEKNMLKCITPDFKEYINPAQLRRLSRFLRIGLSSAVLCTRNAGDIEVDGIVTATGYGFLDETAKFLNEILQLNERQLTPTFFMQSTYNALAGLVALTLKCKGYNNTYVTKGFAFETALYDVMMQLQNNREKNFLVGSFDEAEQGQYNINSRVGHYKKEMIDSLTLFDHASTRGTLQGEGCAFFSVSGNRGAHAWCTLKDVRMIFNPSTTSFMREVHEFLSENSITSSDIDVWISGASGDQHCDALLTQAGDTILKHIPELRFKHLVGEYCTAAAFAVWLGASIIQKQVIPPSVQFGDRNMPASVRRVLIVNQYMGRNYSMILLDQLSA